LGGALASHGIVPDAGEPAAKMFKPLFPLRLNFTGIALPALTMLSVGGLPTGEKNPVKSYSTVTVKLQLAVFPEVSVAVEFTVVVPTEKTEPEAGVLTTVTPGQLSVAVTVKFTTIDVAVEFSGRKTVIFAGQVIVGGVVSFTVNVVVQVLLLLAASFTVIVIVVMPLVTSVPAPGLCDTINEDASVQLSVATTPAITFGTAA